VADVEQALFASKIVAYAQGFQQIQAASAEYGWEIDPGAMARIWRDGCIIRAKFLEYIRVAYDKQPQLPSLLVDDYFLDAVGGAQQAWRRVVVTAAEQGIPTPGFASALAYYDGLRAERLPAALIQGQRDFFGAHTYRRVDKDGSFHVLWAAEGRSEVSA
jgi:6-phosphogluconate dehydrogenase